MQLSGKNWPNNRLAHPPFGVGAQPHRRNPGSTTVESSWGYKCELICLLPPANEVCEDYVFTPVCESFCSQVGGHVWLQGGICGCRGVCMVVGDMHGCGRQVWLWGACMVVGGMHGCRGACVVVGGMHGCGRHA